MGFLTKLFGPSGPPPAPAETEIRNAAMSCDTAKLERWMQHPDAAVRKTVAEYIAFGAKLRPSGPTRVTWNRDTPMLPAMANILIEHLKDPAPAVRDRILALLEEAKHPDVEKIAKAVRAMDAEAAARPAGSAPQGESGGAAAESSEAKIERLFAEAKDLPFDQSEKKVEIYTALLELIASSGSPANAAAVLRNRGLAYRTLERYDEALHDFRAELEKAQSQGDHMRILHCRKLLDETEGFRRKQEVLAGGGAKAERLQAMDRDKFLIWKDGPESDAAFTSYFASLTDEDPDVRREAAQILAEPPKAQQRLIRIYQECARSDPRKASLAGRVLGRNAAKGSDEMIHAEIGQMLYGLDLSFLPCPCVHCGKLNLGIPAPPKAPWVAYYHQDNDRGAYSVPVLCDGCGREFFVVWDDDPR